MKNYLLPIYHSKFKPWIKWWLLKQLELRSKTLSDWIEGTTPITITGAFKGKIQNLELEGNTTQTGTPTPDNPIPVQVVKEDNYIKVNSNTYRVDLGGKNLLDLQSNLIGTHHYITTTYNSDNSITISGTPDSNWAYVTNEITQTLPIGTYTLCVTEKLNFNFYISVTYNDNSTTNFIVYSNTYLQTFTTTKPIIKYRVILSGLTSGTQYNKTTKVMLASGTDTNFSPYVSNPIELCKIGDDYSDYIVPDNNGYKIIKNIEKVVLNGSETGWLSNFPSTGLIRFYIHFSNIYTYTDTNRHTDKFLNDHFTINTSGTIGTAFQYQNQLFFYMNGNDYTSVDAWKTWLQSNNTTVYYVLSTPTTETITNANLISQLNAIYNAEFKNGTNTITQTNLSLPFILHFKYYKKG